MSGGASRAATALGLLAVCFVAFFLGIGRIALVEKDEPRYAGAAREMVRGGDWLVPRFNGQERLVKPPLVYWAIAASFRAAGRAEEGPARIPSAASATLLVLLAALGAGRAFGPLWGAAAGAALATSLLFLAVGRLATTDMPFALLFTAAAACWIPVLEGSGRSGAWILLSGLLAGLAGLAKTPVAILLPPAAAVGAALLLRRAAGPEALPPAFRAGNRGRTALWFLGAVGIFAAVFLLWAAAAEEATGGRLSAALREQVALRFDAERDLHGEPPWYFLALLVPAALPWSLLLPAGGAAAAAEVRRPGRPAALAAYAACLAASVILFFSAMPSKLASYLLPALPALAVLSVGGLRAAEGDPGGRAALLARRVGGGGAVLLAAVLAAAPLVPSLAARIGGPPGVREAAPALAAFAGLLGLGGFLLLGGRFRAAAAAMVLSVLSLVFTLDPLVPRFEAERSARAMARAVVDAGLLPGDRLYDLTNALTGLPWYADHDTETAPGDPTREPNGADMLAAAAAGDRVWAVLRHDRERARAEGLPTQWERLLDRWPAAAPPPRIVFEGMDRVVVTTVR